MGTANAAKSFPRTGRSCRHGRRHGRDRNSPAPVMAAAAVGAVAVEAPAECRRRRTGDSCSRSPGVPAPRCRPSTEDPGGSSVATRLLPGWTTRSVPLALSDRPLELSRQASPGPGRQRLCLGLQRLCGRPMPPPVGSPDDRPRQSPALPGSPAAVVARQTTSVAPGHCQLSLLTEPGMRGAR